MTLTAQEHFAVLNVALARMTALAVQSERYAPGCAPPEIVAPFSASIEAALNAHSALVGIGAIEGIDGFLAATPAQMGDRP